MEKEIEKPHCKHFLSLENVVASCRGHGQGEDAQRAWTRRGWYFLLLLFSCPTKVPVNLTKKKRKPENGEREDIQYIKVGKGETKLLCSHRIIYTEYLKKIDISNCWN